MFNPKKPAPLLDSGKWNRTYRLGKVLGMTVTVDTTAVISGFVLWAVLAVLGKQFLALTGPDVVVGGGLLVMLHYGLGFIHQLGHALAAAQTRHEMTGFHYWLLITRSIYPYDERPLSAKVHIQRAKGGPIASGILSGILGLLSLLLIPVGGLTLMIVGFLFLDNLLIYTVGALLPIPGTDGGTIKFWRDKT
ncbi:MAG: hypothetical protein LCI00_11885 [Chloroflexi bacterium]|nr:hypothetical protein [Chloroflexota bacterium]MCC6896292.1 hypothetical protein [Anaerolineae bacterium]